MSAPASDVEKPLAKRAGGTGISTVLSEIDGALSVPNRPVGAIQAISPVCELLAPGEGLRSQELVLTSLETGVSEDFVVESPVFVVGRGSQCDLRLMHPDVSRRHACIHLLRDRVLCVDLGSRTGIHWGADRRESGWLDDTQPIRIGPFEIRMSAPAAFDRELDSAELFRSAGLAQRSAPVDRPRLGLRFLNQPGKVPPVALSRPITLIGRSDPCKLRLHDDSVSRVHSSLMIAPDGVWIADLQGRGGVRVNGELISLCRLTTGDVVQIGRYRMEFATDLIDARHEAAETSVPVAATSPVPSGGGVSESLLLAMTETFADIQRQMTDQFRCQMEMMVGLIESMRKEMSGEVRDELSRLVAIGEEIRDTQKKIALAGAATVPRLPNRIAEALPQSGDIEAQDTGAAVAVPPGTAPKRSRGRSGSRRKPLTQGVPVDEARHAEGVADHVFMTRRLHDLERERNSHWVRLVSLMKGDA